MWTYKGLSSEAEAKQRWIEYQRAKTQVADLQRRYDELMALQAELFASGADKDFELSAKASKVREEIDSIVQLLSDLKDNVTSYEVGNFGQAGDTEPQYKNPEWKDWRPGKEVPPGWAVDPNDPKSLIEVDTSVTRVPFKFEISLGDKKFQGILEKTALWIPEFTRADGSLDLEGALAAGHEKEIARLYGTNYVDVIKAQNAEKQKIADMKAKGILDQDGKWADDWYDKAMAGGYTAEDLYRYGITPNDIFNAQFFSTVKEKYTLPEGGLDYAKMFSDGITLTQLRLLGVTVDGEPITQSQYEQIATTKPQEPATETQTTQTIDDSARQAFLSTHTLIPDPTGEGLDLMGEPIYMSNDTLDKLKTEQPELYAILMSEGYIAYKNKIDAMMLGYEHEQLLLDKLAPYEVTTSKHRIGGEQLDIDVQGTVTTTTSFDLEKAIRDIRAGKTDITLYDLGQAFSPEAIAETEAFIDATDKIAPYKNDIVQYLRENNYDTKTLAAADFKQADINKALETAQKTPDFWDYSANYIDSNLKISDAEKQLIDEYNRNGGYIPSASDPQAVDEARTAQAKALIEKQNGIATQARKEYVSKYGESAMIQSAVAVPAAFVFAPARALRPDVGIKDIQKNEWILGAGQALAIAAAPFAGVMGSAGTWVARGLQLGSVGAFSVYTAREWKNMTPTERALSLTLDIVFGTLVVGEPFVKWVKTTPLGEDMRVASNKVKEATRKFIQEERGSVGYNYDPLTGQRELSPYRKAGTVREYATSSDELLDAIQSGDVAAIERALKKTGQPSIDEALKWLDDEMSRMDELDAVKIKYEKQQRQSLLYEGTKNGQIDEARRLGVEDAVRKIHANEFMSQRQKVVTAREFLEKIDKAVKEAWVQQQRAVTYGKWLETQKPTLNPIIAPTTGGEGGYLPGQLVWDTPYIYTTPGLRPTPKQQPGVITPVSPSRVQSPKTQPLESPQTTEKPFVIATPGVKTDIEPVTLPQIQPVIFPDEQADTWTKTKTETETKTDAETKTKTEPDTETKTEPETKTETETQTDVRTRIMPTTKTEAWTEARTDTFTKPYMQIKPYIDTETATDTETQVKEAEKEKTKTRTGLGFMFSGKDKTKRPLSKRQQKREERERKKREFAGAFAYRAGVVVHAFKEPYQSQADVATFHINHLPPDIKILPDQKTAIETIQQIRPGAPIDLVIDQGFQDVHVKTTNEGNLTIGFEYDKGNQKEQGITVKKHEKRDRIKLEPLELSTGKAEDMGTNEDLESAKNNLSDVLDKLGIPDEKTESEVPVPESAWGEEQANIPRPVVKEAVPTTFVKPKPTVETGRQPSGFEVNF